MGSQPRIPVSCTSKTQLQCYLWSVTASLGYLLLLKVKKRNILFCAKPAVWEKAYQLGLKVLCVWFCLISPTPARNVATHPNCKWFSTLILSLSLTRLIFPHLNARLKWIFTSVLFLSSLYFFFLSFFASLSHPHRCVCGPFWFYASWNHFNCHLSLFWKTGLWHLEALGQRLFLSVIDMQAWILAPALWCT